MVRSIDIKKASVRDRLIIDVDVFMNEPDDFDFSPRASMEGNSLSITTPVQMQEGASTWTRTR